MSTDELRITERRWACAGRCASSGLGPLPDADRPAGWAAALAAEAS
jgi:hypothetical protein